MYVRMCVYVYMYVCMYVYIYRYISSYLGTLYSEFQDESHPYDLPPKNAWFQRLRSVSQRHGVGFGALVPGAEVRVQTQGARNAAKRFGGGWNRL